MDLSLLPTSDYNKQRMATRFTVRSANSPSYSLSRRLGVRKREEAGECHANGTNMEEDSGCQARTRSCIQGQSEEKETKLNQNGTADKTTPVVETNPESESRGRTEWRRNNLPSRSKSLDWRAGQRSPDRATKKGGDVSKWAAVLEEGKEVKSGAIGRATSSLQGYNSADVSGIRDWNQQILDRTSRGQTLPSRLRLTETSSSVGPKGGQSILERIQKLFGSAGFGKDSSIPEIIGGTFPRHFSSGDTVKSPVQKIWTPKDPISSEASLSPGRSQTRERSPGRQGQIQSRYPEEGAGNWGTRFVESGTKSLDRARSRCTVAAQSRAARGINATAQLDSFLEEVSLKDSEKDESKAMLGETKTRGINGRDRDDAANAKTDLKGADEDVFEMNPHKTTPTGRKKLSETLSSSASVRNKINQFEALTQRAGSQVVMPRRTFSVPTQLSRGHDGVKKSGSAKEINRLREGFEVVDKAKENLMGTGRKLGSERSLSVDEVGLRLGKKETKGNDSDDFGKYTKLKNTLEIPLNGGAERRSRKFYFDETDLVKISSPEEANEKETNDTVSQKTTPSEITSPVSDDDKTPTNTPDLSPFISPAEDATPTADKTKNESTSISTQSVKLPAPDSSPLPHPLATSSHSNLPDLVSPDVKTSNPKGKKRVMDLNAWVAGLNPDFKGWNDNEDDDYEDDDDDESTQKDEDSNYDSDSGESSVTVTSNMSQSDRRSFCMSLADLCNFAGADYESENDSDEWQSISQRSASLSSDVSALSCVSVLPTEELDKLLEDVRSLGDNTLQDYNEVQVVVLHKEVGVGLGFSLAGGVDQNKPITVHKVFHSGVAAQEGSIREGDQVLSINGTALSGSGHWEALRVLRRAKTRDMAVVVLRRGDVSGASKKEVQGNHQGPTPTQTGQRMCLQLQKNSRDLGFSLQGGEGSNLGNRPLTIQKLFQGGPVDQVCPGDEVLEIGGVSMLGMRRLEAWTLIRRLPAGPVDVVLRRPPKHLET
uniref:PDZ domain-containing protein n=1 Tax=Amphiprion percula TaxID=161767 RepID=A0A3P8RXM3_AMPPE